jgi:uncharacterized RDD family membrane protein YckC
MSLDLHVSNAGVAGDGVEYVGFWPRFGAFVIDSLAVMFLVVPLLVWYFGIGWASAEGATAFVVNWILPGVAIVLFWHYRSATPGKMAVSAVVVDARTFGRPTMAQLIGRYAGYYVSTIPLCAGLVWVAFDPRKQGWHDKMANTVVIRKRA